MVAVFDEGPLEDPGAVLAVLLDDPDERVIVTHTGQGVEYVLDHAQRRVALEAVAVLEAGGPAREPYPGRLVQSGDGLLPGCSQTLVWWRDPRRIH
jgi:hypothetical protein